MNSRFRKVFPNETESLYFTFFDIAEWTHEERIAALHKHIDLLYEYIVDCESRYRGFHPDEFKG